MADRRRFPLTDGSVLIAKDRSTRPHEFRPEEAARVAMRCPFCAGHESDTPHCVAAYPARASKSRAASDISGWQVRVVPNKYPAVTPLELLATDDMAAKTAAGKSSRRSRKSADGAGDLFACEPARGVHEVVIEAPDHRANFSEITRRQACYTLRAYRDRMRAHANLPGVQYSLVFRNNGAAGGASLAHVHSQIIATTWIPSVLQTELAYARRAFESTGECLICRLTREELRRRVRVVATTRRFAAFCPYASRFCYETWIVPREHRGRFERSTDAELDELADLMRRIIGRMERIPELRGYNYWIHSTPFSVADDAHYHWHLEVAPRVTNAAGFEWGGGDYINPMPPEEAAVILRG